MVCRSKQLGSAVAPPCTQLCQRVLGDLVTCDYSYLSTFYCTLESELVFFPYFLQATSLIPTASSQSTLWPPATGLLLPLTAASAIVIDQWCTHAQTSDSCGWIPSPQLSPMIWRPISHWPAERCLSRILRSWTRGQEIYSATVEKISMLAAPLHTVRRHVEERSRSLKQLLPFQPVIACFLATVLCWGMSC